MADGSAGVTVTTRRSWLQRLAGSAVGAIIGLLLVFATMFALFWNEGRAVKTARALAEGAGIVVSVDSSAIDPANDGKLVHLVGKAVPEGTPVDNQTGLSAPGAVRLYRAVEMYQWVEKSKSESRTKLGGGEETVTTYTYTREWTNEAVDSSRFQEPAGRSNPPFPLESDAFLVDDARVGAFTVNAVEVASVGDLETVIADDPVVRTVRSGIAGGRYVRQQGDWLTVSSNQVQPSIGDVRIRWQKVEADVVSLVGAQDGERLEPYFASNGRRILLVEAGERSASDMFETARAGNATLTWILRVIGLVVMFIGFTIMMSILGVIGDVIPFVGRLVRAGTGIIAFFMTAVLGSLTIAAGWIAYRPLVALGILAIGLGIAAAVSWFSRSAAQPAPKTSPT